MSGETEQVPAGWTIATLHEHYAALRESDERFQAERDRRYTEVNIEREKALKIKETADLAALSLAREIQDYKDEKANNLRAQIEGERGDYAKQEQLKSLEEKVEALIKPLADYVSAQQGRASGFDTGRAVLASVLGLVVAAVILAGFVLARANGSP